MLYFTAFLSHPTVRGQAYKYLRLPLLQRHTTICSAHTSNQDIRLLLLYHLPGLIPPRLLLQPQTWPIQQ